MKISIIIPVKPGGAVAAIGGLMGLDPDSPDHEIIVAEGQKPSRQRNMAAREATGDILYFLDDDSLVVPDALKRISASFKELNIAAVGGPSLTLPGDSTFQKSIAWALSSSLGGGAIRNRYRSVGKLRDTDDRELILCNLAFRREIYLSFGGLDERLYPNEENELIDRLLKSGLRLLHDPEMFIRRSQRSTIVAFIRQMKTYGKGRAEQTLISRSLDFKAIIPALFVVYILLLPLFYSIWWCNLPILLYFVIILANLITAAYSEGLTLALWLPLVYGCVHFFYGAGFIAGLFLPGYNKTTGKLTDVTIKKVKKFDHSY